MTEGIQEGITLQFAQAAVDKWISATGAGYFAPLTNLGILTEETGELARLLVRRYGEQNFRVGQEPGDVEGAIADEMADVLWVLLALANQCDVNLPAAFARNLEKKRTRDAGRHAR